MSAPSQPSPKPTLYLHEWCAVIVLILVICSLGALSHCNSPAFLARTQELQEDDLNKMEVTIKGAVQFPGTYLLEKNSTLDQLLQKASPTSKADLSQYDLSLILNNNQKIHIKKKKK